MGSESLLSPLPLAQPARQIAQPAERQRQIIFTHDFPAVREMRLVDGFARNVPAVILVAADDAVAGRFEKAVLAEIGDVILQQDQPRAPARETMQCVSTPR